MTKIAYNGHVWGSLALKNEILWLFEKRTPVPAGKNIGFAYGSKTLLMEYVAREQGLALQQHCP